MLNVSRLFLQLLNVSRLKQIREINEEITKPRLELSSNDVITTITNIFTLLLIGPSIWRLNFLAKF